MSGQTAELASIPRARFQPRMSFERQLAIFIIVAATVAAFVACIMLGGISVKFSLLIAVCVLLGGLLFGRPFADFIFRIFS